MLVVPPDASGGHPDTVVIAWKDTPEAVRAITAAAPFLAKAKHIRLVAVAEENEDSDASVEAMADFLTQAGLNVLVSRIAREERDTGEGAGGGDGKGGHACHGRLWPLAIARAGVWRNYPIRASQDDCAGSDDALKWGCVALLRSQ